MGWGWWSIYGQHQAGASYFGGTQPSSHQQSNYAHRHQSHCAWGAGGQAPCLVTEEQEDVKVWL